MTPDALKTRIREFQAGLTAHSGLNCIIADLSGSIQSASGEGALQNRLIAVKDNLNLKGFPTTCASNILQGHESIYTATVLEKIQQAGGQIIAKTNMDEFAMGSSSEHSAFGPVRNPLNEEFVPGGSSGGSAAAVAAGLVNMALGSDTGGSVRQPAAFCGIYGLKPTYGRVSRYGLTAFASSFDQVGIFGKTIEDSVELFEVIAGHDEKDSTSADEALTPFKFNEEQSRRLKIGLPIEYFGEGIDLEIRERIQDYVEKLKKAGLTVEEISLPNTDYAIAAYYILTTAEASSNLARFDGIRYGLSKRGSDLNALYTDTRTAGFGAEVKRRIMLGTFVLSSGYYDAYYQKAQKVRRIIRDDFVNAFKKVDVILTPTSPVLPFKLGEKMADPLQMYMADVCTVPMSLAGVPAMNIPIGSSKSGLPIGLQLTGNFFRENDLFSVAMQINGH